VEDVQEDSDPEPESDVDPHGSLNGGSPRKFSGDEETKKVMTKTMTLKHDHQILISNPQRELGSLV
jgi:hypothetical protein